MTLYARLMRLDKPIGIYLLLWPTLWALWIAGEGKPDLLVLGVFVLGVVLMRSAGCVINDYADRNIDPHVARTCKRPVASGEVTPREALILFGVLCMLAFALVLLMNPLTVYLSFVAVALAALYPFMKRYTNLPQVVLGAAFGWAVPMAFAAQTGEVPRVAWLLFVATVLWTTAYDTMYGMVDREDDLKIGVKSTAILFGESDRVVIAVLQLLALGALVLAGQAASLDGYYYFGLALAAGLVLYQQYLIREREPVACFKAFLNNHWFGAAVFSGIVLAYLAGAGVVNPPG
ncbi:4-hydroxybenzoate polyprenyltransferase [hydrothermal vent metagenome]|uniref:4-hydroxybenzoate polyprenyltransferase n=1 Tax=hydrothermal vent metagenome TaxID=652676 RepID=A0A3B0ZHT9_9ZZZZ